MPRFARRGVIIANLREKRDFVQRSIEKRLKMTAIRRA